MIKLNIDSQKQGKFWLEFSSKAEADAYKEQVRSSAHWGRPAYTETKITPATLDQDGNVISQEVTETILHAAEYSIVEEDISAEIEAKAKQKSDIEALKLEVDEIKKKSSAFTTAELSKIARYLLIK